MTRALSVFTVAVSLGIAGAQTPTEAELLQRIADLEKRLAALESRLAPPPAAAPVNVGERTTVDPPPATTVNFLLDGYYEYNFNRPAGRLNQLRGLDPSSNSFTVNQGAVVIERAPDPAQGRRFGLRLDLMFGQSTETLSGSPLNEPRPAPYRNIYQAYGTYVVPIGNGLTVDFGRFASPIGIETAYAKDQMQYSRSLFFPALPFYHTGFRAAYKINDSTTATWMLVNGANQMEDFNGFKSTHFMLNHVFGKRFNWTGSYYIGRESRAPANGPAPDGRTHIADTYFTWNATDKLTLAGEADYLVSRTASTSPPVGLTGGAAYAKYQLRPSFYLAGRYEYLSDRGGFFSGVTQAIKEATVTAAYQPVDGFQIRWEFRHDYASQPFFLTRAPGILKKDQNTALVGLLFWFGGKQGAW